MSTPLELPAATLPPRQAPVAFTPPAAKGPDTGPRLCSAGSLPVAAPPRVPRASARLSPTDDDDAADDEELDLLLGLDKPAPDAAGSEPAETTDKHLLQEGGSLLQVACR